MDNYDLSDYVNEEKAERSNGSCGCLLIILGLIGVSLFGAEPSALIGIGILLMLFGV